MAHSPISISNFVYAVMNDASDVVGGTPTYGAVTAIPGLRVANYQPASYIARQYGDGGLMISAEGVGDQVIDISMVDIPPSDLNVMLGYDYANGVLLGKSSSVSPNLAVGFQVDFENGDSMKCWFPKVKFTKPGMNGQTKESNITFGEYTIQGSIMNLIANQVYRSVIRTDDTNVGTTMKTNWFNAPVFSTGADLGALSCVVAKSTTKATFTFTKAGGGNITLTQANLTTATLPTYKGTNAVPIAGTYVITNNGTATVTVTFTPTVAYGAVAVSGSVVPNAVYDQNGVYCAASGAVWTSD